MTETYPISPSLRKSKNLRGYAFTVDDLKRLYDLLQEIASEAASNETLDWSRTEDQTASKFQESINNAHSLFRVFVRIETGDGETISQGSHNVLLEPDLPKDISAIEFDSGQIFRERTGFEPKNRVYVLIDCRKYNNSVNSTQPAAETPNSSQYIVTGQNSNWVRSTKARLDEFLKFRERKGVWLHKGGIYDILLQIVGVFFLAWVMSFSIPLVDSVFEQANDSYRYAAYIFIFLLSLRMFMFMFNYARWIWPIVEIKLDDPIMKAHRVIWTTIFLGVLSTAVYDIFRAVGP